MDDANNFAQNNSLPELNLPLESSSQTSIAAKKEESAPVDFSVFPSEVRSLCEELTVKLIDNEQKASFEKLLRLFSGLAVFGDKGSEVKKEEELFDSEIKCWYTQATYMEDTLGYGIQAHKKGVTWSLSTDLTLSLEGPTMKDSVCSQTRKVFNFSSQVGLIVDTP